MLIRRGLPAGAAALALIVLASFASSTQLSPASPALLIRDVTFLSMDDETPRRGSVTAWNGVMKADAKSWDSYLRDRLGKGFNVIQYVTTQWRTAAGN
nr:DUF4038 domain-containing protein [Acidobacteriota bacterium]